MDKSPLDLFMDKLATQAERVNRMSPASAKRLLAWVENRILANSMAVSTLASDPVLHAQVAGQQEVLADLREVCLEILKETKPEENDD